MNKNMIFELVGMFSTINKGREDLPSIRVKTSVGKALDIKLNNLCCVIFFFFFNSTKNL